MKNWVSIIIFLLMCGEIAAQDNRYLIVLTDKANSSFSVKQPSSFLSSKAIARRVRYGIPIDGSDLPVHQAYVDSLRNAGNVTIISASKWLNQVMIYTTDTAALRKISGFSFVKNAGALNARKALVIADQVSNKTMEQVTTQLVNNTAKVVENVFNYGQSFNQVHIHNGEYLHNKGFTGKGITIAVLDGGFFNYKTIKAFDSVRLNNQILGTWDFVANNAEVNEDHPHGMNCFSIMAANEPGKLVGTAPKASYFLYRTEDVFSETPIEEHNWVVAAEKADSAGADMISSSLGYYEFDDPSQSHTYADMNGDKTVVTRGADLAAQKGMIVCNSAGNSGNDTWKYIIAPSDGDSVLAVGAVNKDSIPGSFSSYGPSADGRVKPDVASVGVGTWVINSAGSVASGSGTSFSNPNIAGLIACLWQAFPEFSNMEILDAVKRSSHKYANPDTRMGYGIPDMQKAYDMLLLKRQERIIANNWVKAYPNPMVSYTNILVKAQESGELITQLSDMNGRVYHTTKQTVQQGLFYEIRIDNLGKLAAGSYNVRVVNGQSSTTIRLVK
ncbi:MAG: T9SS C-terminal target domain-containing protein [Sphingobacteriales bacterium]|nr:MAG: T9SS C-terminal target domain-containing protein [Sphingobacteriales bacterium]